MTPAPKPANPLKAVADAMQAMADYLGDIIAHYEARGVMPVAEVRSLHEQTRKAARIMRKED